MQKEEVENVVGFDNAYYVWLVCCEPKLKSNQIKSELKRKFPISMCRLATFLYVSSSFFFQTIQFVLQTYRRQYFVLECELTGLLLSIICLNAIYFCHYKLSVFSILFFSQCCVYAHNVCTYLYRVNGCIKLYKKKGRKK